MDARTLVESVDFSHIEEFSPGDTVVAGLRIQEGDRTRTQVFEGVVIRGKFLRNRIPQPGAAFTVRRIASGIGVERLLPFYSPNVEYVKCKRKGKVRRARLYYLRNVSGKKARIKERR